MHSGSHAPGFVMPCIIIDYTQIEIAIEPSII